MNSVILIRQTDRHFETTFSSGCDDDFYDLIEYILEGDVWSCLIDPYITNSDKMYACGNFYCTRLEGYNLFITDIHQLDIYDYDELKPIIVNKNTVYGLVVNINCMRINKIASFTITQEDQRYTFTATGIKPIVIDPDLGKIYNDMIPLITVQISNGIMEGKIKAIYNSNSLCHIPTGEHLDIFYNIFIKNLSLSEATTRYADVYKWLQQRDNEILIYNDIKITNNDSEFWAQPIKQKSPNFITLTLSRYSLLKFLHAWETQLKFCDSFTLVFLGETLRFFNGLPINHENSNLPENHID